MYITVDEETACDEEISDGTVRNSWHAPFIRVDCHPCLFVWLWLFPESSVKHIPSSIFSERLPYLWTGSMLWNWFNQNLQSETGGGDCTQQSGDLPAGCQTAVSLPVLSSIMHLLYPPHQNPVARRRTQSLVALIAMESVAICISQTLFMSGVAVTSNYWLNEKCVQFASGTVFMEQKSHFNFFYELGNWMSKK